MHSSVGTGVPANWLISHRPASWSYMTTGSPAPASSQTPPKPDQSAAMSVAGVGGAPVFLSNTRKPWLTICTYCVAPTSPFVSGGAQLQPTPGNAMPSKSSVALGIFGAKRVLWRTVSRAFLWREAGFGFGLTSVWKPRTGRATCCSMRSGRDESFLYECPTITRCPEPGAGAGARGTGPSGLTAIPCGEGPAATTPASTAAIAATKTATTIVARRLPTARTLDTRKLMPRSSLVAAEAHRVRKRDVDLGLARLVGHVVEVAGRVGMLVVDRRWQHAVADGQDAHHRLDRAGRPEAVPHHRLGRGDRELVGVVAEDVLDRLRLGRVAERRRGPVRVDVADPRGLDSGSLEGAAHHLPDADRLWLGCGKVVRVVGGAVAEHLGVDLRAARPGGLELLQDERASALPHHEPRARRVEGPRGSRGVLLLGGEAAHGREAGQDQRVDAGLGAAREDRVGVAAADDLGALPHRVRA